MSMDDSAQERINTTSSQYTVREQRRWNMVPEQSIWGPSSPSSSPQREISNSNSKSNERKKDRDNDNDKFSSDSYSDNRHSHDSSHRSRKHTSSHHHHHHKHHHRSIVVENEVVKSESSDDTAYGPSIAYYHSILEQKQRDEIAKEIADEIQNAEEEKRMRKEKLRIAAYKASLTPKP